jgi:hypothetical protein
MNHTTPHSRPRLKGLPEQTKQAPLQWYGAAPDQSKFGFFDNWGWILSPGPQPPGLDEKASAHPDIWMSLAHEWLEKNKTGQHQGLDILPAWSRYMDDVFRAKHPELAKPDTPAQRRPWIDAGFIQLNRTKGGVEVRYCTTGLVAIGIHSGITDKWLLPSSIEWQRQHFAKYKANLKLNGWNTPEGKKECIAWHSYCRKTINQPSGFTGWVLGDPPLKGWSSGRIHVSDTPFSVSICNVNVLNAADTFHLYPSHKEIFDYLRTHKKMDVFIDRIRHLEVNDPTGSTYPRSQMHLPLATLTAHGE